MVKTTRREAIIEFLSYKIPFLDAIASQITLFPGEFYCQKAMRRKEKRDGLLRTTEEFAGRTSIHGVSYAFDKDLGLLDRLLWLLLLIAFLTLAGFLTVIQELGAVGRGAGDLSSKKFRFYVCCIKRW